MDWVPKAYGSLRHFTYQRVWTGETFVPQQILRRYPP